MNTWGLIVAMALLTFLPRYLPFAYAGRVKLPPLLVSALEFVPIAVLTAIVVQVALVRDGVLNLGLDNPHLLAAIAAVLTALIKRSLFYTIAVGLMAYLLVLGLL